MSRTNQRSGPGLPDLSIRDIATEVDLTSANYTVLMTDRYIRLTNTGDGAFSALLPAAPDNGKGFWFKHAGLVNTVTMARGGSDTIEGATSLQLVCGDSVELVYVTDDTNWEVW